MVDRSLLSPGTSVSGDESGHTLAESAVAVALLLTVLVPAAMFLVFLTTQPRTAHQSEALALAQAYLEETIATEAFEDATTRTADTAWTLERSVAFEGDLALVTVAVYRRDRPTPLVTLQTARLAP
ncbi:MAG: hypothetical protein AAFP15_19940 [Bacteroidota bacterium]